MKLVWLLPLFLIGCNEYTAQICTEDVRKDVAGLEGKWTLVGYDSEALQVFSQQANVKRLATGVYLAGAKKNAVYTCELAGKVLMEEQNDQGRWQSYHVAKTEKGFDLALTFFDKAAVEASGIPSTVIETAKTFLHRTFDRQKVLVVDNAKVENPKKVADLMNTSSYVIRFYQQ